MVSTVGSIALTATYGIEFVKTNFALVLSPAMLLGAGVVVGVFATLALQEAYSQYKGNRVEAKRESELIVRVGLTH